MQFTKSVILKTAFRKNILHRIDTERICCYPEKKEACSMKLLILSDLHANLPALEAVWAREKDCDAVLCAGDLVDWGFFPREVV